MLLEKQEPQTITKMVLELIRTNEAIKSYLTFIEAENAIAHLEMGIYEEMKWNKGNVNTDAIILEEKKKEWIVIRDKILEKKNRLEIYQNSADEYTRIL